MPDPQPQIAVQVSPEPTNKVMATGTAAGGISLVIAGVMSGYGGPAITELLGPWATTHPSATALLIAMVSGIAALVATKYGGQAAAYNVLDKPNLAMVPAPAPVPVHAPVPNP